MGSHPFIPVVLLGVFAAVVYFGGRGRAPNRADQEPLKVTKNVYAGTRTDDDHPDSTLTVTSPAGEHFTAHQYPGGVLLQDKSQAAASATSGWTYSYTVNRYDTDYRTDLGAWVGFRVGPRTGKRDIGVDTGLRYSPVRYLYGVVSPDILASPRQVGVGVSIYPPAQSVAPIFQHTGLGISYLVDADGGSGWSPYLSLSTRF